MVAAAVSTLVEARGVFELDCDRWVRGRVKNDPSFLSTDSLALYCSYQHSTVGSHLADGDVMLKQNAYYKNI